VTPTIALLALLAAAPEAPAAPTPAQVPVDRVAALVNGETILFSELAERAGSEWLRVEAMPPGPERERDRKDVLRRAYEQVLAEKLLGAAAVADQVEASDQQVEAAIQDIKTRNNLDDKALQAAVEAQGIDMPTFRQQVKRDLDAYLVLDHRVRSRVKVSEQDVQNYYRSHEQEFGGEPELHVRHIFLPLGEAVPAAEAERIRAEADLVRARIAAGADFATEAKKVSKGPSAAQGGDLGWLRRGTIQKALEDAAFALEPGQVSPVVQAGPGLHILGVEERRLGGGKSFDDAKDEIRNKLYQQQVESFRGQLINDLKKEAVIETRLPELAS
jgi:peptidyl-prolyl cis-trans isomerase SurA